MGSAAGKGGHMWDRTELIKLMIKRGWSKEEAEYKVDLCLENIRNEPILARMYLQDILDLDLKLEEKVND